MTERDDVAADNRDPVEIGKFDDLASRWWDPAGEFQALHAINPLRVGYIQERTNLSGKACLDVGCGGGILTEGLAGHAAQVTGIDLAAAALDVARLHVEESAHTNIRYMEISADALARDQAGSFEVVTCLEVLEHVPDPASLVTNCAQLVRLGGDVFFSTINRNPKAFAMAIVAAEYVMGMVPKGTHTYARFIRPSELDTWGRRAGLTLVDLTGIHYSPVTGAFRLGGNVDVNYIAHFRRANT